MSTRNDSAAPEEARLKPFRKGSWLALILSMVVLQELVFRLLFPVPEVSNFNRASYSQLQNQSGQKTPKSIAHVSVRWISDPDAKESIHALNLYGFRDRNWEIEKSSTRVLIIGDSFVEGFMAGPDETIPIGFKQAAEAQSVEVEALNLGIGGNNFDAYFALIRDAIPVFRPDAILLVFYANDFFRMGPYDPDWSKEPLVSDYTNPWTPRIISIIRRLVNDETVARAWTEAPISFFQPAPSPLNRWTQIGDRSQSFVEPKIGKAMQEGRFNAHVINEINRYEEKLRQPLEVKLLEKLEGIAQYADSFGVALFLSYIPSRHQVSDHYVQYSAMYSEDKGVSSLMGEGYQIHVRTLRQFSQSLGIPFYDLTPLLKDAEEEGRHCYWNYDGHMVGECYLLVGRRLFEWWRAFQEPPPR